MWTSRLRILPGLRAVPAIFRSSFPLPAFRRIVPAANFVRPFSTQPRNYLDMSPVDVKEFPEFATFDPFQRKLLRDDFLKKREERPRPKYSHIAERVTLQDLLKIMPEDVAKVVYDEIALQYAIHRMLDDEQGVYFEPAIRPRTQEQINEIAESYKDTVGLKFFTQTSSDELLNMTPTKSNWEDSITKVFLSFLKPNLKPKNSPELNSLYAVLFQKLVDTLSITKRFNEAQRSELLTSLNLKSPSPEDEAFQKQINQMLDVVRNRPIKEHWIAAETTPESWSPTVRKLVTELRTAAQVDQSEVGKIVEILVKSKSPKELQSFLGGIPKEELHPSLIAMTRLATQNIDHQIKREAALERLFSELKLPFTLKQSQEAASLQEARKFLHCGEELDSLLELLGKGIAALGKSQAIDSTFTEIPSSSSSSSSSSSASSISSALSSRNSNSLSIPRISAADFEQAVLKVEKELDIDLSDVFTDVLIERKVPFHGHNKPVPLNQLNNIEMFAIESVLNSDERLEAPLHRLPQRLDELPEGIEPTGIFAKEMQPNKLKFDMLQYMERRHRVEADHFEETDHVRYVLDKTQRQSPTSVEEKEINNLIETLPENEIDAWGFKSYPKTVDNMSVYVDNALFSGMVYYTQLQEQSTLDKSFLFRYIHWRYNTSFYAEQRGLTGQMDNMVLRKQILNKMALRMNSARELYNKAIELNNIERFSEWFKDWKLEQQDREDHRVLHRVAPRYLEYRKVIDQGYEDGTVNYRRVLTASLNMLLSTAAKVRLGGVPVPVSEPHWRYRYARNMPVDFQEDRTYHWSDLAGIPHGVTAVDVGIVPLSIFKPEFFLNGVPPRYMKHLNSGTLYINFYHRTMVLEVPHVDTEANQAAFQDWAVRRRISAAEYEMRVGMAPDVNDVDAPFGLNFGVPLPPFVLLEMKKVGWPTPPLHVRMGLEHEDFTKLLAMTTMGNFPGYTNPNIVPISDYVPSYIEQKYAVDALYRKRKAEREANQQNEQ